MASSVPPQGDRAIRSWHRRQQSPFRCLGYFAGDDALNTTKSRIWAKPINPRYAAYQPVQMKKETGA
jgi:hypothetical protein